MRKLDNILSNYYDARCNDYNGDHSAKITIDFAGEIRRLLTDTIDEAIPIILTNADLPFDIEECRAHFNYMREELKTKVDKL